MMCIYIHIYGTVPPKISGLVGENLSATKMWILFWQHSYIVSNLFVDASICTPKHILLGEDRTLFYNSDEELKKVGGSLPLDGSKFQTEPWNHSFFGIA